MNNVSLRLLFSNTPRGCFRFFAPAILSCLIGTLVMATSGCMTTSAEVTTAALKIEVDTADKLWLDGESYTIDRFPAALKRHGIPLKQPLLIHTPEGDNRTLYVRVSSVLRRAGYTRFFFVGDPQAEASVGTPKRAVTPRPVTKSRFSR